VTGKSFPRRCRTIAETGHHALSLFRWSVMIRNATTKQSEFSTILLINRLVILNTKKRRLKMFHIMYVFIFSRHAFIFSTCVIFFIMYMFFPFSPAKSAFPSLSVQATGIKRTATAMPGVSGRTGMLVCEATRV
jgi:hypothetical protein